MKAREYPVFPGCIMKFALVLAVPVLLGLSGCGGSGSASSTPPPAEKPAVTVSASPASINAGGSTTLTVSATNASSVTVTGSDGSSYPMAAAGGTKSMTPSATTTYTATASGTGGSATATAIVTVAAATPPPPAATATLVANPTSINAGSSSTLTVTATNATSVTITGTDNSSYTLPGTGGTQAVSPTTTTTYTATATGAGASASATAVVTVSAVPLTTVTIAANPTNVLAGTSSTLTVIAVNATAVTVTGTDNSSYSLSATGGTQSVTPATTTTYTATAAGASGNVTATATLTVKPQGSVQLINHVVFMLQENHTFDNYFGMLNPYREANGFSVGDDGNTYTVDGIDDKLATISNETDAGQSIPLYKFTSSCIDDASSAWISSYGDANRWDFSTTRKIKMDGFVHTMEGFTNNCIETGSCSGNYTDTVGYRAMGYYDQGFLNYYYYMASQFAVSDRWFSPIASKSTPNRIATYTGGTTQGLVYDPGYNDHVGGVAAKSIFQELDAAGVSWKVYYSLTDGQCDDPEDCTGGISSYPATDLGYVYYDDKYIYKNPTGAACTAPTQPSSVVGDTENSFCIDPNHVAPLKQYYVDVANSALPSFAFIEPGYGLNDEHPGSFQPIWLGQIAVSNVINALMASPSWNDSVFFFSYDEGGGPYDHVPPIPGHSNDYTDTSMGALPDISSISVSPDSYGPCLPPGDSSTTPELPTNHCDLRLSDPGAVSTDVAAVDGFGAQIGFRVPNIIVSPFTRRHYVSHIPMDHTAVIKFVENRFIGPTTHLTARDAVQPSLLDFFDFNNVPWSTPPTPPVPYSDPHGTNSCNPVTTGNY